MPTYAEKAAELVALISEIIELAKTQTGLALLFGITKLATSVAGLILFIKNLPSSERDDFIAEAFDQAVGTDENAIVTEFAFLAGEDLEQVSDGIKVGFVAFFNRHIDQLSLAA